MEENINLDNGYKLVFEKELVHSELYECTGYILKDGDLLDDFSGIGLFNTYEDVKIELMRYLIDIEKVEITKENINLFYEHMTDEHLEKYGYILDGIFDDRLDTLKNKIPSVNYEQLSSDTEHSFNITGLIYFGIKDTLKPIEEYIQDIKNIKDLETHPVDIIAEAKQITDQQQLKTYQ